jgi:hypothetical protein
MRKTGIWISLALVVLFASCKDEPIKPDPTPSGPGSIQLVLSGISSGASAEIGLRALVSVEDESGAEVLANQSLKINGSNGKMVSEKVQLQPGRYKISKIIVVKNDGSPHSASPRVNSEKASLVQKPLHIQIQLTPAQSVEQPVEVLAVTGQDRPESFGYPAGSFGQLNNEKYVAVKLQAVLSIGQVVYDSIPAEFKITSWDAAGRKFEKDTLLQAGAKEVYLNDSHVKFSFMVKKWGLIDEMILNRDEIIEGTIYTLGGAKAVRKLKLEETFLFINGNYRPDSRVKYSYDGSGRLSQAEYYQKLPQFAELQFRFRDIYVYSGNNVIRIDRFEEDGDKIGVTEFTYDATGTKLARIFQRSYDQETRATVSYGFSYGQAQIQFSYLYNNGNSMDYRMKIVGGNKVEDAASTSRGGGESGRYRYDFNINPYVHMNMPNIYLSNISRNNMIEQVKSYSGAIPTAEPTDFQYTYDDQGYPAELIKIFRSYQTREILYRAKTVYTY